MEISFEEFEKLSSRMCDDQRIIAQLRADLEAKDQLMKVAGDTIRRLEARCEELVAMTNTLDMENVYLKSYLLLSWSKIRQFMKGLHDFGKVAFLQSFMLKTLSEKMGAEALSAINDVVPMPETQNDVQVVVGTANDVIVDGGVKNETNLKIETNVKNVTNNNE